MASQTFESPEIQGFRYEGRNTRNSECQAHYKFNPRSPYSIIPILIGAKPMRSALLWICSLSVVVLLSSSLLFQQVRSSYPRSEAILLDRHHEVLHELRIDAKGKTIRVGWFG